MEYRSKVYKHRLRSWGCRKQIRLKDHEAEFAQAQLLATKDPSGSDTAQQLLALPDGQTVDLSRLRKYLRRNKHWLYGQRKANLCTGSCPSASVMRPPDVFYVRETLYHNTRAYSKFRRSPRQPYIYAPTRENKMITSFVPVLGRFQDSIRTPADFDEMRGASPHSSRWLAFAHKVQMAVVECRFDDAVTYLREAPKELNHLLIHQPSNILSNLFRFLTSVIRFLPLEDPGARQFLEVLKALLRYGATCLKTSESTCGGVPSRGQPLRLVLESLAKLDDREILLVARRAWSVGCQTDLGLMDEPATVNANIDLLTIMSNGGGDGSELPSNFDDILEQTLKRYEAEGKGHLHLVTMMNRPIYLQMVAEAQGRDPFLDERIVKAFQDAEQCICNMVSFSSVVLLSTPFFQRFCEPVPKYLGHVC